MTTYPPTLIHHLLEKSAEAFPNKVALIHEEVRATYGQINDGSNQLACRLEEQGVTSGDRVVLLLENGLEYVIGYYGALKAGAVVAPLSSDIKSEGLIYLLRELMPRVIISSSKFEKVLQTAELDSLNLQALILKKISLSWKSRNYRILSWDDLICGRDSSNPDNSIKESALASIIYTSGSTGEPKGVMLSHRNIVSNTHAICQYLRLTEKDIQMVVLPFFYVMGKSLLNTHFAVGGTVVINNKFAFPASVVKQMVEEHITGFSGVPSTYAYLLHRSPLTAYRDRLSSLRYCSQAGGHMSKAIKEGLRKALPEHTKIFIMYGATEVAARLSYLEPERFENKMDSIGKAIPGVTFRLLDEKGREVQVGQVGELVASGDNIMQGYWKDPETTAKVLDSNGYHTGDLCYQDEEGFFFLVGRRDSLVKVGGHRINPLEIEDVLMGTGFLMEATVLGMPDELLGHRLVALVAPKNEDCNSQVILSLSASKLPRHKVPSEIKFIHSLPKNASGKIDSVKCLELFKLERSA